MTWRLAERVVRQEPRRRWVRRAGGEHLAASFEYSRGNVEVSEQVAQAILAGEAVVVVHGVDHDGDGKYSAGQRGVSDLNASLPGEATDPALCGLLDSTPDGGVAAGDGSSSTEQGGTLPYVLGGLAFTAAAGTAFAARRSSRANA